MQSCEQNSEIIRLTCSCDHSIMCVGEYRGARAEAGSPAGSWYSNPGHGRARGGKWLDLNVFSGLEPKDFLTAWMRVVGEKEESRTTPRVLA